MSLIALYDACVLHPPPVRDLLIRLAQTGLFQAKWSEEIMDECIRSILRRRPDLSPTRLERTRALMNQSIRSCLVENYSSRIADLSLPDPNDRHVLAAAIEAGAHLLVTYNLRDFPADSLRPHGLEAQEPDEFVLNLIDVSPGAVCKAVLAQTAALKNPPMTCGGLLEMLQQHGLIESVAALRPLLP